ncbi:MAG: hypothetical protein ACXWJ6_14675 [Xanthobacteraceae bacterium]
MLSNFKPHAVATNSGDRKLSLIAVAVAVGILVAACATLVSSAPEPHDYSRTSVLP